jgi:hypothetical protein
MGSMHVKAHLLNNILHLRPSESEILQGANNEPIERSIRCWRTISGRELGLRVDRSGHRVAIKHPSAIQKLMSILPLMKKETIRTPNHLNTKEVVERSQIIESKLSPETISKMSYQLRRAVHQDNVIDITEQIGCSVALEVHKQQGIRTSGAEAELMKKRCDALVPSTRRLLEPIQGPREQANMIRVIGVDEPSRLLT